MAERKDGRGWQIFYHPLCPIKTRLMKRQAVPEVSGDCVISLHNENLPLLTGDPQSHNTCSVFEFWVL